MRKRFAQSVDERRGESRALIIGAGLSGLLAARVLADHFTYVTVLERGRLPERPRPRSGVPQAHHVHLLLRRGREILERFFPGIGGELCRHGARRIDGSRELAVLNYHGWSVRYPGEMEMLTFTRPLLDWCLYRRLADRERITFLDRARVLGLAGRRGRRGVRGLYYRRTGPAGSGRDRRFAGANLVVDASGRFSSLPDWLEEAGYDRPEETVVDSHLGYASRLYEPPDRSNTDWRALVVLGRPPDRTRGGVLLPVEGGRWLLTLAGINRDYPPSEERDFRAFARSLRTPRLYEAVREARPISSIKAWRSTENRLRHVDAMSDWPRRLIATSDAVCALNPIYAQGMSVAALGAEALDRVLAESETAGSISPDCSRRFQGELARINEGPWRMAVSEDLRWPETEGGRLDLHTRALHWYVDRVVATGTRLPSVDRRFSRVVHLVDPPRSLLRPQVLLPVLGQTLRSWVSGETAEADSERFEI